MEKTDILQKYSKNTFLAVLVLLCIMMLPVKVDAAKLDKTSFILLKGKMATVSLKKYPKKTKMFAWKISGKAVKIIQKKKGTVKVKAVKTGTSVLKIKSGNKMLKCTITVIRSRAKAKLDQGSSTMLELGKKVKKAISSNPKVVKVSKKGTTVKLISLRSGKAQIVAMTAGGCVTKLEIRVPVRKGNKLPDKPVETETTKLPETEPETNSETETEPETNSETEPETPGNDKDKETEGNGEDNRGDYWLVDQFYRTPIYDGDTFYYMNVTEDADGRCDISGKALGLSFAKETDMRQISWKLENNIDENGNMIFATYVIATCDQVHSYICDSIDLIPLQKGEADFTISDGINTATFHLVTDSGAPQRARYYEWLRAMVTTELGEEKDITVYGETIHVDGVKGRDDAETIANLAIWVADHKIYSHDSYGDFYTIYRDSYLGAECGGLNSILTDATCVMGHPGWLTLDSAGHTDARAVIDGWTWGYDVGGAGSQTPRAMHVSGLNFEQTENRIYKRHASNCGSYDPSAVVRDYYNCYRVLDDNGNWVEREWVW